MKTNSGKDKIILKKNESISDKNISRAYKTSVKTSVKTSDLNKIIELDSITTLEFVSHELKGILGSTIMCVYSIRDGFLGMLNFKQRATIETIIKNLRRLESTVKDFLDISRIEGGKISSKKLDVNVNIDIIREVEEAFLPEIYEKRLILENNIPDDLIIKTDRTLLLTVFNNLISNAIKYGKTEGKII